MCACLLSQEPFGKINCFRPGSYNVGQILSVISLCSLFAGGEREKKPFERSQVPLNLRSSTPAVSGWKLHSWWVKSDFSKFVGHRAIFKADSSLIQWFSMICFWLMWNLLLSFMELRPLVLTHTHNHADTYTCTLPQSPNLLLTQLWHWQTKCKSRQHTAESKRPHPSAAGNKACFPLVGEQGKKNVTPRARCKRIRKHRERIC